MRKDTDRNLRRLSLVWPWKKISIKPVSIVSRRSCRLWIIIITRRLLLVSSIQSTKEKIFNLSTSTFQMFQIWRLGIRILLSLVKTRKIPNKIQRRSRSEWEKILRATWRKSWVLKKTLSRRSWSSKRETPESWNHMGWRTTTVSISSH